MGHVVTGNLDIVDKLGNFDQLKRVIQLGYKYRVQVLKNKITDKNNGNFNDLNDWECVLKCRVNNRIRAMQSSHTLEQLRYGIDIKSFR